MQGLPMARDLAMVSGLTGFDLLTSPVLKA